MSGVRFVIGVTNVCLNKKGKPTLLSRWRLRKAAKIGAQLRSVHVSYRYAVVPEPGSCNMEAMRKLVAYLLRFDKMYMLAVLTPEPSSDLKLSPGQFVVEKAEKAGYNYVFA